MSTKQKISRKRSTDENEWSDDYVDEPVPAAKKARSASGTKAAGKIAGPSVGHCGMTKKELGDAIKCVFVSCAGASVL